MGKLRSATLHELLAKKTAPSKLVPAPLARKWQPLPFTVREGVSGDTYVLKKVFAQNSYHKTYRKYSAAGKSATLEGMAILDVGANIGAFTRRAAEEGARVMAVEMDRTNFALLRRNTAKQLFRKKGAVVKRLRCAVTAKGGKGSMQTFTKAQGLAAQRNPNRTSLLQDNVNPSASAECVPCISLQQLLQDYGPFDLLKIDVEGYEVKLLSRPGKALQKLLVKSEVLVYFHVDKFPRVAVFACFIAGLRKLFRIVELETGIVGDRGMLDKDWEQEVRANSELEFRRLPGAAGKKKDILLYCR